jgi:crotonobetainyl-CoA:carnitine CoA-transferase CaiB-like acyl-CoA transferase
MTLLSCRVLDLTDEKGFLCGKILADLGAEVIKVERPQGDRSRNKGPFYHGIADAENSLYWFAYNNNKKGITLDIETDTGKTLFLKLVRKSDIVIESFPAGYMASIGLGYSDLCKTNPSIVMTSISPFGQHGLYKDYKASDLTLLAMGGLLYITGYPDRPPVRISFPQSWLLAGSSAASSTMVAYHHAKNTGEGQQVDVSIQASITWNITNTIPLWELNKIILARKGSVLSGRMGAGANQRIVWRCKDGYVAYIVFGGRLGISMGNLQLTSWIIDEGLADDYLKQFDWENYDMAVATQETQSKLESYVEKLFSKFSKLELYQEGLKRDIKIFPVYSPQDMAKDPQLHSRDFWFQVEHPELNDTITYPGFFYRTSEGDEKTISAPPLIGEHNQEIYSRLGITEEELSQLKQSNII